MNLEDIQLALREAKLDGWLFYDHHRRDPIAYRVLDINPVMCTRRWYYLIPREGEPAKLVHRIEAHNLEGLPGTEERYSSWREQREGVSRLLHGKERVAMQYSALNNIPYVGLVDAGTVDLVESCGVDVISSADLVQQFEAKWSEEQWQSHLAAGQVVHKAVRTAFAAIRTAVGAGKEISEYDVQQEMVHVFEANGIIADEPPCVAVNANSADPHYSPSREKSLAIHPGDLVLLDVWGKENKPGAVYFDITWTGYVDDKVPEQYTKVLMWSARRATRPSPWFRTPCKPGASFAAMRLTTRHARSLSGKGTVPFLSTVPGIRLVRTCTATVPTWITLKPTTSVGSSPAPVSPSSPAFTCMNSAFEVKSTCSQVPVMPV